MAPKKKAIAPPTRKKTTWTIMLYVAADGSIANSGVESLEQVNQAVRPGASGTDVATITVAAQFAVDAPAGQQVPRYIFTPANSGGPLGNSFDSFLHAPDNMTEQESLTSFLQWVYANEACKADRYALILWGHGPELLMQPPATPAPGAVAGQQRDSAVLYLTPEELRVALQEGLPKGRKLDLIGFDTCSMSMLEVAYEVRDHAQYMLASQEEVPDASFRYDTFLGLFQKHGDQIEELLAEAVANYIAAYSSYITNSVTGMKPATLSALRLENSAKTVAAITDFATALADQITLDTGLPALLLEAREDTKDFVGGLYVDLVDLATNLVARLSASDGGAAPVRPGNAPGQKNSDKVRAGREKIKDACAAIVDALKVDAAGDATDLFVLANRSADASCNGLSLYFPYCSDDQISDIAQPAVKGGIGTFGGKGGIGTFGGKGGIGTFGGKDFNEVLNAARPNALMYARRQLIIHTEGYYEDLELALDTQWYRFVALQWAKILIQAMPNDLDLRYSAQQAAVNACRTSVRHS